MMSRPTRPLRALVRAHALRGLDVTIMPPQGLGRYCIMPSGALRYYNKLIIKRSTEFVSVSCPLLTA